MVSPSKSIQSRSSYFFGTILFDLKKEEFNYIHNNVGAKRSEIQPLLIYKKLFLKHKHNIFRKQQEHRVYLMSYLIMLNRMFFKIILFIEARVLLFATTWDTLDAGEMGNKEWCQRLIY